MFILINNQLLRAANAEDINTDLSFKVSWICSVEKETSNKIRGFEAGQGRMFLMIFFHIPAKMRQLYYFRLVSR